MPVKGGQHVVGTQLVKRQARHDLRVGQHTRQLVAHGLRGQPVELAGFQRLPDRKRRRVVEDKHIENDVGVQNDGLSAHALKAMACLQASR